jgi:hypothetical protein
MILKRNKTGITTSITEERKQILICKKIVAIISKIRSREKDQKKIHWNQIKKE